MNCPHCDVAISPTDYNCPSCDKLVAKTREELNRIDVKTSKGIAWAMAGMGLAGYAFGLATSPTDWFSALDFVAPTVVLLVGLGGLIWVKRKG